MSENRLHMIHNFICSLNPFVKRIWNDVAYLAIAILIVGVVIIILTAYSFTLSVTDFKLSNTYTDLSGQIRDLDASSTAITVAANQSESYQEEMSVVQPLLDTKLINETNASVARQAFGSFSRWLALLGITATGSVADINSPDDYWRFIDENNNDLINNQTNGQLANIQSDIETIKVQQSQTRNIQNLLEDNEVIIFWITIIMTLINTILGCRLVLVDKRSKE